MEKIGRMQGVPNITVHSHIRTLNAREHTNKIMKNEEIIFTFTISVENGTHTSLHIRKDLHQLSLRNIDEIGDDFLDFLKTIGIIFIKGVLHCSPKIKVWR